MSEKMDLTARLGLNVFKPVRVPHIRIRPGMGKDPRLRPAIRICPAGRYNENKNGEISITIDGCLECGACRLVCGLEVLEWNYPEGGTGVQYRFG